ncbi:hypothetical protein AB0873_08675 [Micromonospora sp. NPDC047707]|uniref:hypothetical protein n=1 Tax=Micromonospora sp. NPDC047707 TaxID=3154498 RepID=UPI0034564687
MVDIDGELVRDLVRAQFPQWSDLTVTPVARQGWDNRTFRLGDEFAVRLPSADGYMALPRALAPQRAGARIVDRVLVDPVAG